MSLQGNINKISGGVRRAVQQIANLNHSDSMGNIIGTRKIEGYVCAINTDGEDAITVDVQEYDFDSEGLDYEGAGLHEGVLLSAIQNNQLGMYIIPQIYSDVIIVQNPTDSKEYVLMYSHVQYIQLRSHEKIQLSVIETEDFVETDDGIEKDYDELEPTGKKSITEYDATTIKSEVSIDGEGFTEETDAEKRVIKVGDTQITIDGTSVTVTTSSTVSVKTDSTVSVETTDAKVKATNVNVEATNVKVDASDVNVNGGKITLTGGVLNTKGVSNIDMAGPYNAIKACPFSGAPHCGSIVSGT